MRLKPLLKSVKYVGVLYKWLKKKSTRIKYLINSRLLTGLDEDSLKKGFMGIGLRPGDRIVVSSSLSSFGLVVGGAETIVSALMDYITPDGLIVMPTYPHTNMYEYLESNPTFSVIDSPSMNGKISEVFRKHQDTHRSCHPTHCISAWGKDAYKLLQGHHLSRSPYDEDSPYRKLLDMNAKTVLFGVNLNHAIMIRVIDDLYPEYPLSPYIPNKTYNVKSIDADGNEYVVTTPCHDPVYSKERYNMAMYPYILPKAKLGKVGKCSTMVFCSQDLYNIQVELSKKNIFPFHRLPLKGRIN